MIKIKPITRGMYLAAFGIITISLFSLSTLVNSQIMAIGAGTIVELSNKQRELLSAQPLAINTDLMNAAQAKAENMAKNQYFSHNLPDGNPPWKFITDTGYSYLEAGENLAMTNQTDDSVVSGWMNSPAHRDNVLNKNFTDTGIGVAYYGSYEGYKNAFVIVAFYAKPGSQPSVPVSIQPTYPAGGMTMVKKQDLIGPYSALVVVSISLLLVGVVIESLHIRTNHKRKTQTQK